MSEPSPCPLRFSLRDTAIMDAFLIAGAITTVVALAACLVLLLLGVIG